jgi:hypothetical protein
MIGYGNKERVAICTHTSPNMTLPFAMLECTAFVENNSPAHVRLLESRLQSGGQLNRSTPFVRENGSRRRAAPKLHLRAQTEIRDPDHPFPGFF